MSKLLGRCKQTTSHIKFNIESLTYLPHQQMRDYNVFTHVTAIAFHLANGGAYKPRYLTILPQRANTQQKIKSYPLLDMLLALGLFNGYRARAAYIQHP